MKQGKTFIKWSAAVLGIVFLGMMYVYRAALSPSALQASESEQKPLAVTAAPHEEEQSMPELEIRVADKTFSVELYDNEAAAALLDMLPMQISMQELNGNEKYYYLSQSLPTQAVQPSAIHTGDLMLFGSDCLVLFYEDSSTSYSYTSLGKITNPEGLAQALGTGSVTVSFEKKDT